MAIINHPLIALGIGILHGCAIGSCASAPPQSSGFPPVPPQPRYCKTPIDPIVRHFSPPVKPKYFFKPVGNQNEIAFVGEAPGTQEDQNFLLNTITGQITPIPGRLDPIGLFNTDLLSVPIDDDNGGTKMSFYDLRQLRAKGLATPPLYQSDESLMGRYQSLGTLRCVKNRVRFRIITDGNEGGNFRDFEVNFDAFPAKLRPLHPTRLLCSNLRDPKTHFMNHKLPMLSKNGQQVAFYDLAARLMKVYQIHPQTGNCTLLATPFPSRGDIGKFDFSPDSSQAAFHYSDRNLDLNVQTFGRPAVQWQLRSAVFDFKKQAYQLLPFFGKGANTYYPAFLDQQHILTLQLTDDQLEFIEVDLSRLPYFAKTQIENLVHLTNEEFAPFQALSDRFTEQCYLDTLRSTRANRILGLLALDETQCLELAHDSSRSHPELFEVYASTCKKLQRKN